MYATLLDLQTGEIGTFPDHDANVFSWTDNDNACDCNRATCMGKFDEQQRARALDNDECLGEERFVVVAVHGDLEGHSVHDLLQRVNADYSKDAQTAALNWQREQIEQERAALAQAIEGTPYTLVETRRPRL